MTNRIPSPAHRLATVARAVAAWLGLAPLAVATAPQAAEPPGAAAPAARAEGRPFLWRIDGEVPRWLFGTFHLPDERVTTLDPAVEQALAGADAVFTEVDMDTLMSPALLTGMRMPAGKTLNDVAPPELVSRLARRLGVDGPAQAALQQVRPWVLAMQAMAGKRQSGEVLDAMIYNDSKSAGREVGGLESVAEQLAVFDGLGLEGEVTLLKTTLDVLDDYEKRGLDLTEEMIAAWCAGDTVRVLRFFDEMNGVGLWAALEHTLVVDRNLRMAERIDRRLREHPRRKFVFAVGTAHLIGATSIVDLLRARGYVVTRVPETMTNLDEELEQLQRETAQRQARIEQLLAKKAALARPPAKKAG